MKSLLILLLASVASATPRGVTYSIGGSAVSFSSITGTNFASGGVIFSTTSGVLTDDPAGLFYKASDSGGPLLGVGTASPGTTLHVASGVFTVNGTGAAVRVAGTIASRVAADLGNSTRGIELVPATFDGENRIRSYGNTSGTFEIQSYNTGDNIVAASLTLDPSPAEIGLNTGNGFTAVRRLTVNGTGNVGINDSSPDAQLEVLSTSTPTGFIVAVSSQNDTTGNIFAIRGNGDVGIGVATPGAKLDIAGGIRTNSASSVGLTMDRSGTTYGALNTDSNHVTLTLFNSASFDILGGPSIFNYDSTASGSVTFNGDTQADLFKVNAATDKVEVRGVTTGGALCLNASNQISKCTSAVDASGNCTCP